MVARHFLREDADAIARAQGETSWRNGVTGSERESVLWSKVETGSRGEGMRWGGVRKKWRGGEVFGAGA